MEEIPHFKKNKDETMHGYVIRVQAELYFKHNLPSMMNLQTDENYPMIGLFGDHESRFRDRSIIASHTSPAIEVGFVTYTTRPMTIKRSKWENESERDYVWRVVANAELQSLLRVCGVWEQPGIILNYKHKDCAKDAKFIKAHTKPEIFVVEAIQMTRGKKKLFKSCCSVC